MKFAFSLLVFLDFSYCFAQTNPMEYFYEGKETLPDFAALAVLESQHCPNPIAIEQRKYNEYGEYIGQICTSRYRILHILDSASDTLKKEYIEAKGKPVLPYFRHRPILIFGKRKNGFLQIEGYEETRGYFDFRNSYSTESILILTVESEIYAFHSIGSPYLNARNLDSIDMAFYNEYLMPRFKFHVEGAGKNFSELLLRLIYNRTPIKAAKIRNDFAVLAVIKNVRPAGNPKQSNIYELSMVIETIFKNDAKINPNIAIFIDRDRLPPSWGCPDFSLSSSDRQPFYLFADLKNGNLVVDSLVSTLDAFVFGDTIYDISMGLPYEELITYFLPSNMSLEEFKFGWCWGYGYAYTREGIIHESLGSLPDSLKKAILEITIKYRDFIDNKYKSQSENAKFMVAPYFLDKSPFLSDLFRCRRGRDIY
jgi:hypothetical protein